jgi:hypothetical protein
VSTLDRRLELHALLVSILGKANVYFQPPASVKMVYPCVRYELDFDDTTHADNIPYTTRQRYLVTFISDDPDDEIYDGFREIPTYSFSRAYVADNLNHKAFKIYY